MKIVIINGVAGAGKDCFVSMCRDILGEKLVCNISTVDFVKEVATFCGWDGEKTPKNRKFLSDLKKLLTEWDDVPVKKVVRAVENYAAYLTHNEMYNTGVVFIHCREPKQINRLVEEFDGEPITLMIRRTAAELEEQSNDSDKSVYFYGYDYTIFNDSNLSWLYNEARVFLRDYLEFDI